MSMSEEATTLMEEVAKREAAAVSRLPEALREIAEALDRPVFHSACTAGEVELVKALLGQGIGPDEYPCTEDEEDEPPLVWIAQYRDYNSPDALMVAELLIGCGAGLNEGEPLRHALGNEDTSFALMLLAAGASTALDESDTDPRQDALLAALLETGWVAHASPQLEFYIAVDEDQKILGAGIAEEEVRRAANRDTARSLIVLRASGRLVARYLSGEEVPWTADGGIADLEEPDQRS